MGREGERDWEEERRRNGWRELGMRHLINSVTDRVGKEGVREGGK